MVEDVEGFGAEFEVQSFFHRNSLEQRHVEVGSSRIPQRVTPGISEGQAGRSCERVWIVKERRLLPWQHGRTVKQVGVADDIGIGSGSHSVSNSGVIIGKCDAKRSPSLKRRNARELPSAKDSVSQTLAAEERQVIDVADIQNVPLIEVRARAIGAQIIGIHKGGVKAVGRIIDGAAVAV